MSYHDHNPGGKVRIKLKADIRGDAVFSACGLFRPLLTREWDGATKPGFALWIGMNPSTAAGDVNDPTVAKECKFTRKWGYGRYVKCNVMDYRATKPAMLLGEGIIPCSDDNLPAILKAAREADMVILAYGALHKKLAHYGRAVVDMLTGEGIEVYHMGLSKEGHPRHPLYIRDITEPQPFRLLAA